MSATDPPQCDAAPAERIPVGGPYSPEPAVSPAFSYPSVDPGLPALDLDHVLGAHAEMLSRLKVCYGASREAFEHDVMTVVRRYAAFVHLLPATPANYFNEPGGLLRLGLETAFYALQGTDAHIFSGRAPIAARRHLEPRWRLATFIAGLCAELHRAVGQVVVTDREGAEWPAYLLGLQPWLAEGNVLRYYLKWLPNAPECTGLALFALPHIVPAKTLQHLAQGNKVVVPHLMASLSRMPLAREHNILDELVRRSAALVIDRFLQTSADQFGKPMLGSHLERYLVDALRRLVATHTAWTPNAERSRVWYGADGLYVVWPNAATDIRKLLEGDQLPGIPKSAATMQEILLRAGILQAQPDGKPLWWIRPPAAKAAVEAVKLIDPAIVLVGLEHKPQALPDTLQATASPADDSGAPAQAPPASAPRASTPTSETTTAALAARSSPPAKEHQCETTGQAPDREARAAASSAHQLELQVSTAQPPSTTCLEPEPAVPLSRPSTPRPGGIGLDAPMRLAQQLRAALADILQEFNAARDQCRVRPVETGLFIALIEFERRHVEPSQALHAISDARMLVRVASSSNGTSTVTLAGEPHLGLTVAARFLTGWTAPCAD